jgi:O-acetyl-ADP-ribose deacetylase (regulator of RNase III)
MKIEYRKGDVLMSEINHIVHGCNSRGVMGSGVAKAIRDKYSKAYTDYSNAYNNVGLNLGDVITSQQENGVSIYNAITQSDYGRNSDRVYVSYWAIAQSMKFLDGKMEKLAMPMIGAGLANGNWYVISAIIENTLVKTQPIVYVLDN